MDDIKSKKEKIHAIHENYNVQGNIGPYASSLDVTLKMLGVERPAYYGRRFIGNHCHKMLKV